MTICLCYTPLNFHTCRHRKNARQLLSDYSSDSSISWLDADASSQKTATATPSSSSSTTNLQFPYMTCSAYSCAGASPFSSTITAWEPGLVCFQFWDNGCTGVDGNACCSTLRQGLHKIMIKSSPACNASIGGVTVNGAPKSYSEKLVSSPALY